MRRCAHVKESRRQAGWDWPIASGLSVAIAAFLGACQQGTPSCPPGALRKGQACEALTTTDASVRGSSDGGTEKDPTIANDGADADPAPSTCHLDRDGDGVGADGEVPCTQKDPGAQQVLARDAGDGASEADAGELVALVHVAGDCNDENPAQAPGLEEICDSLDNDCNGETDEGIKNACGGACVLAFAHQPDEECDNGLLGTCYRSGTYQCSGTQVVCSAPAVEPSDEVCDDKDNDCDGDADEEDAIDVRSWYQDCDGDGFGAGASFPGCRPPKASCSFVTNNKDCADTNANMKPGQTVYFTTAVNSSFDYDCSKVTEKQYTRTIKDCEDFFCGGRPYWDGNAAPACGATGSYCDIAGCRDKKQACR